MVGENSVVGRRSERSRRSILDAALRLARERGYARLSIEAVAAEAAVGKQTIYRWWPSLGAVVLDAYLDAVTQRVEWTPEGDLAEQLVAQLTRVRAVLLDPEQGPIIAGVLGDCQSDPELAGMLRARVVDPSRTLTMGCLLQAQESGQLDPAADLPLLADALFAPLWFRLLIGAAPLADFDPATHVKQLLTGSAHRPHGFGREL